LKKVTEAQVHRLFNNVPPVSADRAIWRGWLNAVDAASQGDLSLCFLLVSSLERLRDGIRKGPQPGGHARWVAGSLNARHNLLMIRIRSSGLPTRVWYLEERIEKALDTMERQRVPVGIAKQIRNIRALIWAERYMTNRRERPQGMHAPEAANLDPPLKSAIADL